ncbi:MAG: AAA family ATPase [Galactobacter sp.]
MSEEFVEVPPIRAFDWTWLAGQEFPPLKWIVQDIIPEGLTILSAAPKVGKSWLSLNLAGRLAYGHEPFSGVPAVAPIPVLYFALEDGARRLQDRARKLAFPAPSPDVHLQFVDDLHGRDPRPFAREFVQQHSGTPCLVIVDTLGKALPAPAGQDKYRDEYEQTASLKRIVDASPGSGLIVVHHNRQMKGDDFVEEVGGTSGITGAADTIVTLKRDRNATEGVLNVTGRDLAGGRFGVTFDGSRWELVGNSLDSAREAARDIEATQGIGDNMTTVVLCVGQHPEGVQARAVAEETGLNVDTVGRYLRRAADDGRIEKRGRGVFAPVELDESAPTPVRSVRLSETEETSTNQTGQPDTTDTPPEETSEVPVGAVTYCVACKEPILKAEPGQTMHPTCQAPAKRPARRRRGEPEEQVDGQASVLDLLESEAS